MSEGKVTKQVAARNSDAPAIANAFHAARRLRKPLASFPGDLPTVRDAAYAIQDEQIALSDADVVGWKVAVTAANFREGFGDERLSGPVFAPRLHTASPGQTVSFDVFEGGFAAVEAEIVAKMGEAPLPYGRMPTVEEAMTHVASLHIGIETAGSPLASINDLGPMAVVSDCGNNDGVIIGPAIADWQQRALDTLHVDMTINGSSVGAGNATNVRGGPMAAVAFLIGHLERRGQKLKAGDIVSTGAITGIHMVSRGQSVRADFGRDGCIDAVVR